MINITIAIISGYLLGSIPSAYVATRLKKNLDIREVGSRNMGAINVYNEAGLPAAVLVFLADAGKGIAAIVLARWLGVSLEFQLLAGLAVIIGHIFPVFLKFRGGKGGAAAIGVLLFLMPKAIPFWVVICLIALLITRNLAFCYAIAFICFPFVAWLIYHTTPLIFFSLGLPAIVGTHHIPRLRAMYAATGGSWWKVIRRSSLKARL